MKLERLMKNHYAGLVDAAVLPPAPGTPDRAHRGAAPAARPWFDLALNLAVHALLAATVVLGLPGLREASPLSTAITRAAVAVSLDRHIESRVKSLSENIHKIRNTN